MGQPTINTCVTIALAYLTASTLALTRTIRDLKGTLHNTEQLLECDPEFALRVMHVIQELQNAGFHPFIRQSWRSLEAQERAFSAGKSELQFGFHNVTGPAGEPHSFAVDLEEVLDARSTSVAYALALAKSARKNDLSTGLLWGLPQGDRARIEQAIKSRGTSGELRLGWDPCHLEPASMTLQQARHRAALQSYTRLH